MTQFFCTVSNFLYTNGQCSCTVFRNLCCCTRCFRCKNFCLLPAVFRSRSFDYVVLNRQKPYKTSFVGGQVFRTSVCCKICKNFCLLPAVFRSRSFEHVVFAYVVFTQAKLCAMQVSQVGNFFARRLLQKLQKLLSFTCCFSQ